MFGYACDETPELMPAPIYYAHRVVERQPSCARTAACPSCAPTPKPDHDALCGRQAHSIDTVVLSTQHSPDQSETATKMKASFYEACIEEIIKPVLPKEWLQDTKYLINPTGRFVIGGPQGDCGLTGRKIIVDTYGGACPTAAARSAAKDPSKVGPLCRLRSPLRGQEHRGWRPGAPVPDPGGVCDWRGTPDEHHRVHRRHWRDPRPRNRQAGGSPLRPAPQGIIQMLDLLRPSTARPPPTATGREEPRVRGEKTDKAAALRAAGPNLPPEARRATARYRSRAKFISRQRCELDQKYGQDSCAARCCGLPAAARRMGWPFGTAKPGASRPLFSWILARPHGHIASPPTSAHRLRLQHPNAHSPIVLPNGPRRSPRTRRTPC